MAAAKAYSDEQKTLAVAVVKRYGIRPGERWLKQEWPTGGPSRPTLIKWSADAGIIPTEEDEEALNTFDRERKARWQAGIDATRDDLIEATAKAARNGEALKTQQFATATGIFYDKLVPVPRPGAPSLIGNATGPVQIVIAATPNPPQSGQREVPSDYDEADGARDIGDISVPDDAA